MSKSMNVNDSICLMGVDVGGTKIAAGLLSVPDGRTLATRIVPTQPERGGRAVLDDVLQQVRELVTEAEDSTLPVGGIGLGICELVNLKGELASDNCIKWLDMPVQEELSAIAPATIEADVRAAAIAEAHWGAGKDFGTFLYVTVGTGIACCLMIEGRPYLGAHGATGTMASSSISVPCQHCGHVSRQTLEEISAGPALVKRFNALHGQAESGHDVVAAATSGNAVAMKIVQSAGEALESQIGLIVNVLDPEAVIIGGGLGLSEGPFWDHFIDSTRKYIWSDTHKDIPILRAATGVDAGWIGAATNAWKTISK